MKKNKAIFLDRDGVINKERNLITHKSQLQVIDKVPLALNILKKLGYKLIVISNQTVVARDLLTEDQVSLLHIHLNKMLIQQGNIKIDHFYFCPHHPNANNKMYRQDCACRKPKAGLLIQAAKDWNISLEDSYMVGDRISDINAGYHVGNSTILVESGAHKAPKILSNHFNDDIKPDFQCADLFQAAQYIQLQNQGNENQ
jgi:D-glycero-D-manno-heptose 1,7-bisphosphate phosphatase